MRGAVLAAMCVVAAACSGGPTGTSPGATPTITTAPSLATIAVAPPIPTATIAIPRPTATSAIVVATASPSPRVENVDIRDNHFFPSELTVSVYTRVLWINGGEMVHDVVANNGTFHSSSLTTAARFSYTLRAARPLHVLLHAPRGRPHVRGDRRRIDQRF